MDVGLRCLGHQHADVGLRCLESTCSDVVKTSVLCDKKKVVFNGNCTEVVVVLTL